MLLDDAGNHLQSDSLDLRLVVRVNPHEASVEIANDDHYTKRPPEEWVVSIPYVWVTDAMYRCLRFEFGAIDPAEVCSETDVGVISRSYAADSVQDADRLAIARTVATESGLTPPDQVTQAERRAQDEAWAMADAHEIALQRRVRLSRAAREEFLRAAPEKLRRTIEDLVKDAIQDAREREDRQAGVPLPARGPIGRRLKRGGQPTDSLSEFIRIEAENRRTGRPRVQIFADAEKEDAPKKRFATGRRIFRFFHGLLSDRTAG